MDKDLFGNTVKPPVSAGEIEMQGFIGERSSRGVRFSNGFRRVWLPLQNIRINGVSGEAATLPLPTVPTTVIIPEWLAKDRGLIQ